MRGTLLHRTELKSATVAPATFQVPPSFRIRAAISLNHLQTVEKSRLRRHLGSLGPARLARLCSALAFALGCDA